MLPHGWTLNILSKTSQTQKATFVWFNLCDMSGIGKSIESRFVVAGIGNEDKEWGRTANGIGLLFGLLNIF